jgi:3-isopropylmalate/(R)-2-methylmalate dehydratase small subunit
LRHSHSSLSPEPCNRSASSSRVPSFCRTRTSTPIRSSLPASSPPRYDASGAPRADFILNKPEARGCEILVAGRNFGCGSSREHAPWALLDFGFKAVISTEIADIFRNNALKNGLLPIVIDETTHRWLLDNPGAQVRIDLERTAVELPTGVSVTFPIEAFARYCLLNGIDELGFLLKQSEAIARYEQTH